MWGLLIALTYVAEAAGIAGIVAGLVLLVRSGPAREQESTTYWYGGQQISRAEYEHLRRRR